MTTDQKRVVLLNPPGRKPYLRDYYCSKTSKSGYSYTPVDFLYIGAHLKPHCRLDFIDCIADGTSPEALLARLAAMRPDAIVALTGYVSWREDFALFAAIKAALPATRLVGSGDLLQGSNRALILEQSRLDAILYDFSSPEIADYCLGGAGPYEEIAFRTADSALVEPVRHGHRKVQEIRLGIPPHEIFPLDRYEYPFVRQKPFATVLTDYSCPYRCSFCIMSVLGYKYRGVDDVIAELDHLKAIGIREIYFADQTFGANKRIFRDLLEAMIARDYGFGWVCFTRADVIDEANLALMKRAGCHTVIFGVEFGNDANLETTRKDLDTGEIDAAIALCRRHGVRTVGTFMMGEPTQTVQDLRDVVDYSTALGLDFASYNVYVPRTDDYLRSRNSLDEVDCFDQSGGFVRSFSPHISDAELAAWHRRARRRFYLRPSWLWRRLSGIRTTTEAKILIREGLHLVRGLAG